MTYNTNPSVMVAFAKKARSLKDPKSIKILTDAVKQPYLKGKHKHDVLLYLSLLGHKESEKQLRRQNEISKISVNLHSNFWNYIKVGKIHPLLRQELNNEGVFKRDKIRVSEDATISKTKNGFKIQDRSRTFLISKGSEFYMEEAGASFHKVKVQVR